MSDTIRALVVEPCKEPYIKDIESGLESLQKEVGGLIEAFYPYGEIIALPYKAEDKKPSIRQQLAAIKENTSEKKDIPKTKNKEIGGESL